MMKKTQVAVVYGGRSGEHEVSLRSAASVIRNLDSTRYEIIPILIDKKGHWPNGAAISPVPGSPREFDVVFPVMHGTFSEDGTIQGLLELAEVPYVGCGVLASAVGMDKDVAKRLARDAGIPIVPFVTLKFDAWSKDISGYRERIQRELGFPVFVKPCNAGSSVGVHKVKDAGLLESALRDSFQYDTKVLVERAISAREIEVSVLESAVPGAAPLVSLPGEVVPTHEFYSYEAKYLDENGAALVIPAKLAAEQIATVQRVARETFVALECEGMARVDFFLDKASGALYLNEINTLPGFTSISMYPKMWEASGLKYGDLLSKLVDLALARHRRKMGLLREFALSG